MYVILYRVKVNLLSNSPETTSYDSSTTCLYISSLVVPSVLSFGLPPSNPSFSQASLKVSEQKVRTSPVLGIQNLTMPRSGLPCCVDGGGSSLQGKASPGEQGNGLSVRNI
jgi:hypothetical protein